MTFDDLVKYILKEAPITDVELSSETLPNTVPFYPDPDYQDGTEPVLKLFRNKRYRERLQAETAKNIPFNIKIVFFDSETADYSKPEPFLEIKPIPGAITLAIDATGGDTPKLSPNKKGVWMVGHKLGHAIDDRERGVFVRKIAKILINSIPALGEIYEINFLVNDNIKDIFRDISGMNSVQTGDVASFYEYVYELVAQYVMFGKVTFRVGNILKTPKEANNLSRTITQVIVNSFRDVVGEVISEML